MRGSELAEAMASAVDRLVTACEGTGTLDRAIEAIVGTIGWFGGKDATSYLEACLAEMVMRDIPEDRQLAQFPQVAMWGIHVEVLEVRAESRTWEEFEGRLLEKYGLEKGRNTSMLQEFGERFTRRSTLDQTILDTSHILLFVKVVDVRDREQVVLLLETDNGLTAD